jgi:hypothetical protein
MSKFLYSWDALETCEGNFRHLVIPKDIEIPPIGNPRLPLFPGSPGAVLGPGKEFLGPVQDELHLDSLYGCPVYRFTAHTSDR